MKMIRCLWALLAFCAVPVPLRAGAAAASDAGTLGTALLVSDAAALATGGAAAAPISVGAAVLHVPAALSFAGSPDGWGYSVHRYTDRVTLHALTGYHAFDDGQGLLMAVRYGVQTPWDVTGTDENGCETGTWQAHPAEWLLEAGYMARASAQDALSLSVRWTSSRIASPLPSAAAMSFQVSFVHCVTPSATSVMRWQWALSASGLGGKFDYGGTPVSQPLRLGGMVSGRTAGQSRLGVSCAFETGYVRTGTLQEVESDAGCWLGWRNRCLAGVGLHRDWRRNTGRVSCGVKVATDHLAFSVAYVPSSGDPSYRHACAVSLQMLF